MEEKQLIFIKGLTLGLLVGAVSGIYFVGVLWLLN